jgi:hypothetical protein
VTKFAIKQSELSFEAAYATPAFGLLQPGADSLHGSFMTYLSRYGLTLNDIRVEGGTPNLSSVRAIYLLGHFNAAVTVLLDRLEAVFLELHKIGAEHAKEIVLSSMAALQNSIKDIIVQQYKIGFRAHIAIHGMAPSDLIARHTQNAPSNFGPVAGAGVAFYFGPEEDRLSSSLILDASVLHSDAVFLNTSVAFDASKKNVAEVLEMLENYYSKMFESIGLEVV